MTIASVLGASRRRSTTLTTASGVPVPAGWSLQRLDTFGTGGSVPDVATLHKYYTEGQYYNTDGDGHVVANPINGQQQTYTNFEAGSFVFFTDHLQIQARGAAGPVITSGQISSRFSERSVIFEARITAPATPGSWVEFWGYPIIAAAAYVSAFTASISGTTMTVTALTSGLIQRGQKLTATGITSDTFVDHQVSGTTGGAGDYVITASWSLSSRAFTASAFDRSELDVEIPIGSPDGSHPAETVHNVSLGNFNAFGDPATSLTIFDSNFTTAFYFWTNPAFDVSTGPHYYTIYYDDTGGGTIRRYIDGNEIYSGTLKWMLAMGGTGFGPDINMTIDLAAGGVFPGGLTSAQAAAYTGNLDIYSAAIYSPRPVPAAQAWDQSHKSGSTFLSLDSLTATAKSFTFSGFASQDQPVYAIKTGAGGRFYWEVVLTAGASGSVGAGIGVTGSTPTRVLNSTYIGFQDSSIGWFASGGVFSNNGSLDTWATYTAISSTVRLCFALDLVSNKIWGRVGTAGPWNNAAIGSQNPAVGSQVGGTSLPTACRTNTVPGIQLFDVNDTGVGVFASGSWAGTPPTGFGQW